jgi:adenylosuccinate synthase
MLNLAVVGAQWGDEGKGKVVDLLCERFDVVARYQGGPNAGHTVRFGDMHYALHHVPSGVFREGVRVVIGNGMVLDLQRLLEEMDGLAEAGIDLEGRLFISDRASVILPLMKQLDAVQEDSPAGGQKIGTTLRGIGPTYQAKAARTGVRIGDLADPSHLEHRIRSLMDGLQGRSVREAGMDTGDPSEVARELHGYGERLRKHVADTAMLLNDWMDEGSSILFEGAQGTLLDLDHGTYPFVTSSSTVCGGLCGGLGIAPSRVGGVLGVFKSYCTRVGSGPMPTELDDGPEGLGQKLRDRGHEYGTTTGRPRRCGWFDGVAARYVNRINRFEGACVTLLDVLDRFDEIGICTGYRLDGREIATFPASAAVADRVEPFYEYIPGWGSDTSAVRRWDDLPANARAYLDRLGGIIGSEVVLVGVGPDREQSIVRPGSWLESRIQS